MSLPWVAKSHILCGKHLCKVVWIISETYWNTWRIWHWSIYDAFTDRQTGLENDVFWPILGYEIPADRNQSSLPSSDCPWRTDYFSLHNDYSLYRAADWIPLLRPHLPMWVQIALTTLLYTLSLAMFPSCDSKLRASWCVWKQTKWVMLCSSLWCPLQ